MRIVAMGTGGSAGTSGPDWPAVVMTSPSWPGAPARGDPGARPTGAEPLGDLHLPDVEVTDDPAELGKADLVLSA